MAEGQGQKEGQSGSPAAPQRPKKKTYNVNLLVAEVPAHRVLYDLLQEIVDKTNVSAGEALLLCAYSGREEGRARAYARYERTKAQFGLQQDYEGEPPLLPPKDTGDGDDSLSSPGTPEEMVASALAYANDGGSDPPLDASDLPQVDEDVKILDSCNNAGECVACGASFGAGSRIPWEPAKRRGEVGRQWCDGQCRPSRYVLRLIELRQAAAA